MILNNEDGLKKREKLKSEYLIELELVCLNSEYFGKDVVSLKLKNYLELSEELRKQSILKESEFHNSEKPYYESSIFCDFDLFNQITNTIKEYGIEVDIVHYQGNEYDIYDFIEEFL
jgi:hypothetical protein